MIEITYDIKNACHWALLLSLISYRQPMKVNEVMLFHDFLGDMGYYVCPRCHVTLEIEFASFCDRCGQHLNWKNYDKARIVYPGTLRESDLQSDV